MAKKNLNARPYNSKSIEYHNPGNVFCDYGCGQLATYYSYGSGTYRCAKSANSCPEKNNKARESITKPQELTDQTYFCDYGCGMKARYLYKNGIKSCQISPSLCPEILKANSDTKSQNPYHVIELKNGDILCDYGCDDIAHFQFENGKNCCFNNPNQCPGKKETTRQNNQEKYGKDFAVQSDEVQELIYQGRISAGQWTPKENRKDRNKRIYVYYREVMKYTEKSWIERQKELNPQKRIRSIEWHLDHIFSIQEGYRKNIPAEILGHWSNLRMLPAKENVVKHYRSDKTIEQLYEDFYRNGEQ